MDWFNDEACKDRLDKSFVIYFAEAILGRMGYMHIERTGVNTFSGSDEHGDNVLIFLFVESDPIIDGDEIYARINEALFPVDNQVPFIEIMCIKLDEGNSVDVSMYRNTVELNKLGVNLDEYNKEE